MPWEGEQGGDNMPGRSCPLRPRRSSWPLAAEPQRNGGVLRRRKIAGAEDQERESGRERPRLSAAGPSRPHPGGRSRPRVGVVARCTRNIGEVASLAGAIAGRTEFRSDEDHGSEVRLFVSDMGGDFALEIATSMDGGSD
jgi:hypothetical protein